MKKKFLIGAVALSLALFLTFGAACTATPPLGGNEEDDSSITPPSEKPTEPPKEEDGEKEEKEFLTLSREEGVFSEPFELKVTAKSEGNKIYYTLDGTLPTAESNEYESGIAIGRKNTKALSNRIQYNSWEYGSYNFQAAEGATTLRLLETTESGEEVGRKTLNYFYGANGAADFPLPVVSIVMSGDDAISFYNDIAGESKKYAVICYYDFKTGECFQRSTQIKLGGNWTKGFPYRTMNINFNKDENGAKNEPVDIDLFSGRKAMNGEELTNFTRFRLHTGGNAQTSAWFSDAFTQNVAAQIGYKGDKLQVSTTGYRPCEVYLSGEYWGIYAIREHYTNVYFAQNYGVDKDDVILLDRAYNLPADPAVNQTYAFEVKEEDKGKHGMEYGTALFDFLMNTDLSVAANYERFTQMVDVTSLSDLMLTQLYAGNWDFMRNNLKMWRTAKVDPTNPYADGKWRFCLHDLDFAFESQWGDNGVSGANAYLLTDNHNTDSWRGVNISEYSSSAITYRPGYNFLDYYLGNGYLTTQNIGYLSKEITCLLSAPMQNASFRETFVSRVPVVKGVYASDEAKQLLTKMQSEVSGVMQKHLARWNRVDYSYSNWQNNIANIQEVLSVRPYLKDYLNFYESGRLMYVNGDYFDRQVEAALWRFVRDN